MKISEYQTNCHAEAVRIANAKTAIATAIEGKGVTVPDGTLLDGIAPLIESIETGGGGVQPDWNQNDETAADYIKNRPFYTGNPVETVLVEERTVSFSFSENEGVYKGQFESTFSATVGETYKVSWDGTAYECTCVNFHDIPIIGNLSILGPGSDTGEPFVISVYNGKGIQIGTADTSASHTISISATVVPVVKIDPKYIRDMYYTGDPVETVLVEESTVSFSFSKDEGVYKGRLASTFSATVGETYKVSWDGTAYECACVKFKNKPAIGNLSILGPGSDTGEPFVISVYNGEGIVIATADTSASHTVSISATAVPVVKIDEKYLPDSIISDINDAQSTANAAQTTADTAQSTADAAQSTADAAQSTANAAQSTANAAQSTANAAQTTANAAQTTADGCVKIDNTGSFRINLSGNSEFSASDHGEESYYSFYKKSVTDKPIVLSIGASGGTALDISVTPSTSPTVRIKPPVYLSNMADIEIGDPSGYYPRPQITGLGGITMYSSTSGSTKKFKITVDDSGKITATEVT